MPETQAQKRWIVTISGERSMADIEKSLTEMGFKIDQSFAEIGSLNGSGDEETVEKLRKIPGVSDVSPEETIDIGPPDAPITW